MKLLFTGTINILNDLIQSMILKETNNQLLIKIKITYKSLLQITTILTGYWKYCILTQFRKHDVNTNVYICGIQRSRFNHFCQ